MARSGAVALEEEPLLSGAVIAAQGTVGTADGFRQRDVRFFAELFSNWLESTTLSSTITIHNVQVQRYLDVLPRAGWAKRVGRRPPRYRLTPEGLVELIGRLARRRHLKRLDEFFLVYHLIAAYGARLRAMVERSGPLASSALAVDIDALLDPAALVERERATVARAVQRLSVRAEESRKMSDLTRALLERGEALDRTIAIVEKEFAYELNSQKPLSELLEGIPEPWRRAELERAARHRAHTWDATAELLKAYDGVLARLGDGE